MPFARVALWVAVNGAAAWLGASLFCVVSPEVAGLSFGLGLGFLQSVAISRSWREALSWSALTAITLPLAGSLIIILLVITTYGSGLFDRPWIPGAIFGLLTGAALGTVQAAVFAMRGRDGHAVRVWVIGNSIAGAVVGAGAAFTTRAAAVCSQDLSVVAVGVSYGLLTAIPLVAASARIRSAACATPCPRRIGERN